MWVRRCAVISTKGNRYLRFASWKRDGFLAWRKANLRFQMISMIPCPRTSKTCSGNNSPLKSHPVVRRRPVRRRHRLVIQAQIHAKLGAVVYQVIEEHLPVG